MHCVEMKHIRRVYPGVVANDDVSIQIQAGKILCLVGENGAGKSTLMKILYGLEKPDGGEIFIRGKRVTFHSSRDAIKEKIGMVHQHFMLVDELSVLENIILGMEPTNGISLNYKKARQDLTALCESLQMPVPLDAPAGSLPVGLQQKVEILKIMYRGADIIILDEPTAVLTPQETKELFVIMRDLAKKGHTLVIITHKLDEVMEVGDDIVVMRRGEVVSQCRTQDTNAQDLAIQMVGNELPPISDRTPPQAGTILDLKHVTLQHGRKKPLLKNINLSIHAGEVLGIAGISGNGQPQLADLVAGLQRPSQGHIMFEAQDITQTSRQQRITQGISYIPEDRNAMGLCGPWSIAQNLIAGYHHKSPYVKSGLLQKKTIAAFCNNMIEKFDIRTHNGNTLARSLSGGNQQKIIVAREFSHGAQLIVAAEPTRGVDIGAINFIHNQIINIRNQGKGVMLFSSDLDEIFKLSDRIAVLFEGEIVLLCQRDAISKEELGLYMAGVKREVV